MRKLFLCAVCVAALAAPSVASAGGGYGSQPGYEAASPCGSAHGAFGAFNGDYNIGDFHGTPGYHEGLVGQEHTATEGATGYNNSHTGCQS